MNTTMENRNENWAIDKAALIQAVGNPFKSKYDLYDALFNNVAQHHKITVERDGKAYQRTVIDATLNEVLMTQIRRYSRIVMVGRRCYIEKVFHDRLAV